MGIFGQSTEKKLEKRIRQEAKDMVKELADAGMDRRAAQNYLKIFQEVLIDACEQRSSYMASKASMMSGKRIIEDLLADMDTKTPENIRRKLMELALHFTEIYHECTIRKDDLDFASTHAYLYRMAKSYQGTERIMLQSELENLLHMMSEIVEWVEPDFCALALLCRYGNREDLAEIENGQRNIMLMNFYRGQYWDDFENELVAVGMEKRVKNWIKDILEQEGKI